MDMKGIDGHSTLVQKTEPADLSQTCHVHMDTKGIY